MPIKNIKIYKEDLYITLDFQCSKCNKINEHTINHAKIQDKKVITINFSTLGKRCCDNMKCDNHYELYN